MIGAKGDRPAGFDGWLSRSARKSKRLADRLEEKRPAMYERELDEDVSAGAGREGQRREPSREARRSGRRRKEEEEGAAAVVLP